MAKDLVVAFIDQGTCRLYLNKEDAPIGTIVFCDWDELGAAMTRESMDATRTRLMGGDALASSSKDDAARKLWHLLCAKYRNTLPTKLDPSKKFRPDIPVRTDNFGNRKYLPRNPVEVVILTYVPGKDVVKDFYYNKLWPQAKLIIDTLMADGRGAWTNDQMLDMLEEKEAEFKTRQGVWKILRYHRSRLIHKRLIKRVSYEDFAKSPAYKKYSLVKE